MLDDSDKKLFHSGDHIHAYKFMGSIPTDNGVFFRTFAPHASSVYVVGDFNDWNNDSHPMNRVSDLGIWELYIDEVLIGSLYKYCIQSNGKSVLKADPYAKYAEVHPATASVVYKDNYHWHDEQWMFDREKGNILKKPLSIYEINLLSWKKNHHQPYSYLELVDVLIPYLKSHHFTHVEIMPIMEHPFDGSWGYQLTGYYAITSRYGSPADFKYLIDRLHQDNIGVILDWVPAHFCKDIHGLCSYDGYPLYEPEDEYLRENTQWGTLNFDYSRPEIRSFLISAANYLFKEFHIDGMRIDAVAYMLHQNMSTGRYDLFNNDDYNMAAIHFLKQLNSTILGKYKNVLMMAEDSSAYPMVTYPVYDGGLGFNYKWNMGWMNDTLEYFSYDPIYRSSHQDILTFSIYYAFNENFVLPFSHDEVVHGKKSLIQKMAGDYWHKFANLRAMIAYQFLHPGKKLNFMGNEFAQFIEWDEYKELDWFLLDYPAHHQFNYFFKSINYLYISSPQLYEIEHDYDGFQWIEFDNHNESIIAFRRMDSLGNNYYCIFNFTPVIRYNYNIVVQRSDFMNAEYGTYKEIFNSDRIEFNGSGIMNSDIIHSFKCDNEDMIAVDLPPLAAIVLEPISVR